MARAFELSHAAYGVGAKELSNGERRIREIDGAAERVRGKYPLLFFIPLFSAHVTRRCH